MEFRSLEVLVAVAALGSFHRAAARLGTTQPAVSQRIAQLEAQLGTRLLVRDARRVFPTPAGRELLAYAERLLHLRDEMVGVVADRAAVKGVFRLGAAETVVNTWLPRLVRALSERYPRLSLELEVDVTPRLQERLAAQELDLAFMMTPSAGGTAMHVPLCSYPVRFVAPAGMEWPRRPVPVADLARWPVITFPRSTRPYAAVARLLASQSPHPVRLHASASLATAVLMVRDGIGIAAIPPAIVRRELDDGTLVLLEAEAALPDLTFAACWTAGSESPTTEAVVGLARAICAEDQESLR